MRKAHIAIASLFALTWLLQSASCCESANTGVSTPSVDEEYVSIFNPVDEFLMGDLHDTVSLEEL